MSASKSEINRIESLEHILEMRELDSQMKLSQFVEITNRELVERNLLQNQLKQMEEKNAALTKQFNELYQYCEGLYQDADRKRKIAEKKIIQSEKLADEYRSKLDGFEKKISELQTNLESVSERESHLSARNVVLEEKTQQLTQILEHKQDLALSTVERGKDCVRSTMRSMSDFFGSFQIYLDSIERNGMTPITIRTGKLLFESWRVQRENLEKVSESLNHLLDAQLSDSTAVSNVTPEDESSIAGHS